MSIAVCIRQRCVFPYNVNKIDTYIQTIDASDLYWSHSHPDVKRYFQLRSIFDWWPFYQKSWQLFIDADGCVSFYSHFDRLIGLTWNIIHCILYMLLHLSFLQVAAFRILGCFPNLCSGHPIFHFQLAHSNETLFYSCPTHTACALCRMPDKN